MEVPPSHLPIIPGFYRYDKHVPLADSVVTDAADQLVLSLFHVYHRVFPPKHMFIIAYPPFLIKVGSRRLIGDPRHRLHQGRAAVVKTSPVPRALLKTTPFVAQFRSTAAR